MSEKTIIALLRSFQDIFDSSSINIWSLRDSQRVASSPTLPDYDSVSIQMGRALRGRRLALRSPCRDDFGFALGSDARAHP